MFTNRTPRYDLPVPGEACINANSPLKLATSASHWPWSRVVARSRSFTRKSFAIENDSGQLVTLLRLRLIPGFVIYSGGGTCTYSEEPAPKES